MTLANEEYKGLNRTLTIEIERIDINNELEKKIHDASSKINIKGFRKGKIPKNIISERYGKTFYEDIKMDLLNKKIKEYVVKENINLVDNPVIISQKDDKKNNLIFNIEFEIFPNIKLNIEEIKVEKINIKIEEDDIKKEIEHIQEIHGFWNVLENDEIKYGDKVNIDISGRTDDDKDIKKYDNKNINLILDNENYLIKNIKEKIIACKFIGKYEFFLKNDVFTEEKTNIIIRLNIKQIERKYPAILDFNLANKLNIENINKINDYAKSNIEKNSKYISYSLLKNEILDQLVNIHEFEIPNSIIEREIAKEKYAKMEIIKDIKLKLLLNEIKSQFGIEISENQVQEKLSSLYPNVSEKIYKNLLNNLLIDEIIKFLIEKINIKEVDKTINDLISEGFIK